MTWLSSGDCVCCGSPVLAPNPLLATEDDGYCSQSCRDWQRQRPGRRRERLPCERCGDTMHPAYAIGGRWCSMRCRDRTLQDDGRRRPGRPGRPTGVPTMPALPGAWVADAACAGMPEEVFFGEGRDFRADRAREVCAGCPVRQPCLEYALAIEDSQRYGTWGGTSPGQRRRLAREREAAPLAAAS